MKNKKLGILGFWHLGSVYAAAFASFGFKVTVFDFNKNIVPPFEPGLKERLTKYKQNITKTFLPQKAIQDMDYVFVIFDVPVNDKDQLQIKVIDKIFGQILKFLKDKTTVVISSQVPVGTSRRLENILSKKIINPKIIYFPENLRLGQAFDTFLKADRIILGSNSQEALDNFKKDFAFFNCPIIEMSLESAEMVKHALNAYLATCISFSSELSDIAEKVGANMIDVVEGLKTDKRVSPFAPLNPGLGFAGGTLGRDVQTLKKIAAQKKTKAKLLKAIYEVNQDRVPVLIKKIKTVHPILAGKNIGLLGLTYTKNTDTLRRSMALELAKSLNKYKANIRAYDPAIKTAILNINLSKSLVEFFQDLDLAILITGWDQFKQTQIINLAANMKTKAIIDTKNFLDAQKFKEKGFLFLQMGVGE